MPTVTGSSLWVPDSGVDDEAAKSAIPQHYLDPTATSSFKKKKEAEAALLQQQAARANSTKILSNAPAFDSDSLSSIRSKIKQWEVEMNSNDLNGSNELISSNSIHHNNNPNNHHQHANDSHSLQAHRLNSKDKNLYQSLSPLGYDSSDLELTPRAGASQGSNINPNTSNNGTGTTGPGPGLGIAAGVPNDETKPGNNQHHTNTDHANHNNNNNKSKEWVTDKGFVCSSYEEWLDMTIRENSDLSSPRRTTLKDYEHLVEIQEKVLGPIHPPLHRDSSFKKFSPAHATLIPSPSQSPSNITNKSSNNNNNSKDNHNEIILLNSKSNYPSSVSISISAPVTPANNPLTSPSVPLPLQAPLSTPPLSGSAALDDDGDDELLANSLKDDSSGGISSIKRKKSNRRKTATASALNNNPPVPRKITPIQHQSSLNNISPSNNSSTNSLLPSGPYRVGVVGLAHARLLAEREAKTANNNNNPSHDHQEPNSRNHLRLPLLTEKEKEKEKRALKRKTDSSILAKLAMNNASGTASLKLHSPSTSSPGMSPLTRSLSRRAIQNTSTASNPSSRPDSPLALTDGPLPPNNRAIPKLDRFATTIPKNEAGPAPIASRIPSNLAMTASEKKAKRERRRSSLPLNLRELTTMLEADKTTSVTEQMHLPAALNPLNNNNSNNPQPDVSASVPTSRRTSIEFVQDENEEASIVDLAAKLRRQTLRRTIINKQAQAQIQTSTNNQAQADSLNDNDNARVDVDLDDEQDEPMSPPSSISSNEDDEYQLHKQSIGK